MMARATATMKTKMAATMAVTTLLSSTTSTVMAAAAMTLTDAAGATAMVMAIYNNVLRWLRLCDSLVMVIVAAMATAIAMVMVAANRF